MYKLMTFFAAMLLVATAWAAPKTYELKSPDGKLVVKVDADLHYTLTHGADLLIDKSCIAMYMTDDTAFGEGDLPVRRPIYRSVNQTIDAEFYKKSQIKDHFNEMTLKYKDFSVIFRAYDDGMAYRFVSHLKKPYQVENELAHFNFAQDWNMWTAYVAQHTETLESQFYNSFENQYTYAPISKWNKDRLAFLPLMVDGPNGKKIVITEADLMDYPGMYLYNNGYDKSLIAHYASYPKDVKQGGHNNLQMEVQSREDYIAKCDGPREFPWRIIAVSETDVQMADNDMVYRLATPADPQRDWSWVKP